MRTLVTGAAGFIGSNVCRELLASGDEVAGVDNLDPYYDVTLKQARLDRLTPSANFTDYRVDLADREAVERVFEEFAPERVVNLAAQAGVRYAFENPYAYINSNVVGFLHVLEGCKRQQVKHLVYASTSSVYGGNTSMPFSVSDSVDHPLSLYAASKKSNELMAHCYSHLHQMPVTGLRFFTVYGPWGRPDMALFLFTRKMLAGEPIDVFNNGNHRRDFTYVDDIVGGVTRVLDKPATPNPDWSSDKPDPASSNAPYRLYNIGNSNWVELTRYIEVLEECLGVKAKRNLLPLQPGDVPDTYADVSALVEDFGYKPSVPVEVGIANFVEWYREYYKV